MDSKMEKYLLGIYNIETNEILYTENINYSFGDGTYFCNSLSGIININIITISCNDVNAFNYNPSENDCENCCCYIAGCLDETAFNYDSTACFDDGSCISVLKDVLTLMRLTIIVMQILMMNLAVILEGVLTLLHLTMIHQSVLMMDLVLK